MAVNVALCLQGITVMPMLQLQAWPGSLQIGHGVVPPLQLINIHLVGV